MSAGMDWPGPPETRPDGWDLWWDFTRRMYLKANPYPLYLRFGELPRGNRSRVWWTGEKGRGRGTLRDTLAGPKRFEPGVACYAARQEADNLYTVHADTPDLQAMWKALRHEGRRAFHIAGEEAGDGTDGEPTLRDARVIRELLAGTRIRAAGHSPLVADVGRVGFALRGMGAHAWVLDPPEEIVIGERADDPRLDRRPEKSYWEAPPKDLKAVLEAVLERSTSKASPVHGEGHWRRVAVAGARLCKLTPGADALVALLFAVCHDAMRLSDGHDPHHARRANKLMMELLEHGEIVSDYQLDRLWTAIDAHDRGAKTHDPSVAVCWDADRLCLSRVGKRPDPRLLSTAAGPALIEWARQLQHRTFTWKEVMEIYEGSTA